MCSICNTLLIEDFLNTEDPIITEKLEMLSPLSLEVLFIKLLNIMDYSTYNEILHEKKGIDEYLKEKK